MGQLAGENGRYPEIVLRDEVNPCCQELPVCRCSTNLVTAIQKVPEMYAVFALVDLFAGPIESTMELKDEILREHSKRQSLKIARWVGADKRRFRQLMTQFLQGEYRVTQRSAWVIGHCVENHPVLVGPWLKPMLTKMDEQGVHVAVKRNVVRILAGIEIPRPILGKIVARCFEFLTDEGEAIAVRVHAMAVILNACRKEPALANELRGAIGQMLLNAGPALRARARHVLRKLDRIGRSSSSPRTTEIS